MKFNRAIHIFIFLATFNYAHSANEIDRRVDSLLRVNKNIGELKLLDSLSWQYRYSDIELAVAIADRLQVRIESAKIDSISIVYLVNISSIYRHNNEFEKATDLLNKAAIHAHRSKNFNLLWRIYNSKGNVFRYNNDMNGALKAYFISLKIAEYSKDEEALAATYNNIASIYFSIKRNRDALKFFLKSYRIYKKNPNTDSFYVSAIADNIGMAYFELKEYDKALAYHLTAMKGFENSTNLEAKSMNYTCISIVLLSKKLYEEALKYIDKAIKCSGNSNTLSLVLAQSQKTVILYELGKFDEAEQLALLTIALYDSSNTSLGIHETYYDLTKIYIKKNEVDEALRYLNLYRQINDSLNSSDSKSIIANIEAKYEAEKQEQQIALLEKDKKNKQLIIYSTSGGLVLLLVLAFIIFKSYREKRKSNILLVEQNQIIQDKNKDITDSINYAQRIQLAMQPSIKQIKEGFPNSFILYKPKDIVSGDFFWFAKQNDNIFIAAADCTGHGVPGALMSMIGINFLNQLIIENTLSDTADILNQLHNKVKYALASNTEEKRDSNDGMDIALVKINKRQNTLQFSGAVRPFYYFENNELKMLKGDRYSIGGIKDDVISFASHAINLPTIQSFYIFSDGFVDQFGGNKNKKFMVKHFQELLTSVQALTMNEQESHIEKAFNNWKATNEQMDDVLVMGFKPN